MYNRYGVDSLREKLVNGCKLQRTYVIDILRQVTIFTLSDFFFFYDAATPQIYTSLFVGSVRCVYETHIGATHTHRHTHRHTQTHTHTRLSHTHISEPTRPLSISYVVFCLKKKKNTNMIKSPNIISLTSQNMQACMYEIARGYHL